MPRAGGVLTFATLAAGRGRAGGRLSRAAHGGAVAQLGERLNGIQEVRGSIPLGSTKYFKGLAGNGWALISCRQAWLTAI